MRNAAALLERGTSNCASLTPPEKIYISESTGKGQGVFAKSLLDADELIETCTVRFFTKDELEMVRRKNGVLRTLLFLWDDNDESKAGALVLGYGAIYNHSLTPNAYIRFDDEKRELYFFALRQIEPQEEITFDYDTPLWFEPVA